ncbi:MAG: DUF3253 domain-containing protein [Acidobacteriota bacterium]
MTETSMTGSRKTGSRKTGSRKTETSKICQTCGRSFAWRAKWRRSWEQVRYCGERCRRNKPSELDRQLESAIESLLARRGVTKTICPSEAARAVAPDAWRPLMERTRSAARRLAAAGRLEVLAKGRVIDATEARGPIRLRWKRP